MPDWDPSQYGKFLENRTRPSRDLAQRLAPFEPRRIVDLGCGPGNSTAVCFERWPNASILGLDRSPEMIQTARASNGRIEWRVCTVEEWIETGERADLIFSNATMQWVPDHARVFPQLLERLNPGGMLAAQMPHYEATPNRVLREMAAEARWRKWFPEGRAAEWRSHSLEFYHEVLAPRAAWHDLWATDYMHLMPDVAAIVEWYKGTGLRPYLERIGDDGDRREFLAEYTARLAPSFPTSKAGDVPFLFRRLFIVAGVEA